MANVTYTETLVAIFETGDAADGARKELMQHGFNSDQVEITGADAFASDAASGNAALTGDHRDSSGGGVGGFFRRMFGRDDHQDRDYYSRHLRENRCALVVHANGESADRAAEIMNRNGAVQIQDESATGERADLKHDRERGVRGDFRENIPVVEEQIRVGKRPAQRGGVRVYSRMTEHPIEETVSLREEHVRVERRPVDREATQSDFAAADRGVIEVNEIVEEPVIEKRARVVEEVRVGKDVKQREETVRDTLRRNDVRVEDTTGRRGADRTTDSDPAYVYGHDMASDARYRGRRWEDVENDLRTDYSRRYPESKWDEIKTSVRHGWDKVTGRV